MRASAVLCGWMVLPVVLASAALAQTQTKPVPGVPEPVPEMLKHHAPPPEPTTPPARPFHDARYGVSFTVPAAWNLNRKDGEVSTFALDAPTSAHTTQLRAVANINFNPHPTSTFSGALFYFSVTPHTTAAQCGFQASAKAPRTVDTVQIGGLTFNHGYSEHGGICTESRDEIYTTQRKDACYRFDVVINNFCGGDVSGVRDITEGELDAVRGRMKVILDSVKFDSK